MMIIHSFSQQMYIRCFFCGKPGAYSRGQDIGGAYSHGAHILMGSINNVKTTNQQIISDSDKHHK